MARGFATPGPGERIGASVEDRRAQVPLKFRIVDRESFYLLRVNAGRTAPGRPTADPGELLGDLARCPLPRHRPGRHRGQYGETPETSHADTPTVRYPTAQYSKDHSPCWLTTHGSE